jgi:predicted transcriptional regulator
MSSKVKTLTVRLPLELYERVVETAERRDSSLNATVQEALHLLTQQDQQARLYEAFSLLGEDAAEADVEFAFEAQRQVVTRDPG